MWFRDLFSCNRGSSTVPNVWEATKAYLWGIYIKPISVTKSKIRALTSALQNRLDETEQTDIQTPTSDHKHQWLEAHTLLDNHVLEQADPKRFFVEQQYYLEGERAGNPLTSIAKDQGTSLITELKTVGGVIASDPH